MKEDKTTVVKTEHPTVSNVDFRLLFESSPNLYLVLLPDAPKYTIVAVNDAYLSATGTIRSQILGRGIFEVFPDNPQDLSATGTNDLRLSLGRVLENRVQDVMGVQKYDIPSSIPNNNEFEERYWSPINTPVLGDDGSISYIIHRVEDITEFVLLRASAAKDSQNNTHISQLEAEILSRALEVKEINRQLKATQNELIKNESKFRQIMDSNMIGILFANFDGQITDANEAFLSMVGYTRKELLSKKMSWKDLTPEEFLEPDQGVIEELRTQSVCVPYEKQFFTKNRNRVDVFIGAALLEGSQDECVAFVLDITEQKRLQAQIEKMTADKLKQSKKKIADIQFALDQSTIVTITDKYGVITYANEAFCQISQYSQEEVIGQNHRIVNSGYHPKSYFKEMWTTIGRGMVWKGEFRNKAKDGTYYWVDATIVPFLDTEGKPYQYIAVRSDITQLKQAEEKIRQWSESLEQKVAERTAQLTAINKELESFSYSVSHDLRAPLRSIDGFSQILLKEHLQSLDETAQHYLQRIRANSQRMAQLIDDMLNLSRVSRGELRIGKVNLSKIASTIAKELHEQEPEREGSFVISEGMTVNGDERLLTVLLQNLLSNAWKFTSKQEKALIEFGFTNNNGKPVYFVKDNGAGFDMAYAGKLFGAFQRLHGSDEYPGTGIGLATVQRIITRHGGEIWAEGEVDTGAAFYFTL